MKANYFKPSVDSISQCKGQGQPPPHYVKKKLLLKTLTHSKLYIILLLAALVFIYFSLQYSLVSTTYHTFHKNFNQNEIKKYISASEGQKYEIQNEMACHIPVLNPFDPTVLKYMKETKHIDCGKNKTFPLLFKTDLRSMLIQVDEPEKYGYFNCCYSPFTRAEGSDLKVDVSNKCTPITSQNTTIPEEMEFIQVNCQHLPSANNKTKQIIDLFGFVRLRSKKSLAMDKKSENLNSLSSSQLKPRKRKKVNVVIFGLDGVSHMNFIRTMPLTFEYLTRNLSGLGLKGYTKVGDNTFPNMGRGCSNTVCEEPK